MLLGLDAIVWANVYNDLHWSFARLAMMPPMHPAAWATVIVLILIPGIHRGLMTHHHAHAPPLPAHHPHSTHHPGTARSLWSSSAG